MNHFSYNRGDLKLNLFKAIRSSKLQEYNNKIQKNFIENRISAFEIKYKKKIIYTKYCLIKIIHSITWIIGNICARSCLYILFWRRKFRYNLFSFQRFATLNCDNNIVVPFFSLECVNVTIIRYIER